MLIRLRAELVDTGALPNWRVEVRNVNNGNVQYTVSTAAFSSGSSGATQNLAMQSGWDTATRLPSGARDSAPFAILDTAYRAIQKVIAVSPTANFPNLTLSWATTNVGGQTFFSVPSGQNPRIVLSGESGVDTDEFDTHVIAHEFGHYVEYAFARSDNVGGSHGPGDRLDPRVAYSEGFGYWFAGYVLDNPEAIDTVGTTQQQSSRFNIETNNVLNPGWYSEASVWTLLWDLYDSVADSIPGGGTDTVALGAAPIWTVITGALRNTESLATIFVFVEALKAQNAAVVAAINTVVASQSITAATLDAYGTDETNNAGNASVLPLFSSINVGGGARTVRSLSAFGSSGNKLGNSRFLRLIVNSPQSIRIVVTAPAGRDADLLVTRQGLVLTPNEANGGELNGDENFTVSLPGAGTYVLETYDCHNANCTTNPLPADTDIVVTVTTN